VFLSRLIQFVAERAYIDEPKIKIPTSTSCCYWDATTSPILRQLHWLPVRQRIEFNLAMLVFKNPT